MKANLKGLSGIKGLALRHGEKIVIAIIGLVSVWFIYKSVQLPRLEDNLQADKLKGLINSTNTAITGSTWPEEGTEEAKDIRTFKPIAKNAIPNIEADKYPFHGIDAPIIAATQLRSDPVVKNAVGVRAYGRSGLLAFRDENTLAEQQRRQQLKDEEQRKAQERQAAQQQDAAEAPGRPARPGGPDGEFGAQGFDPDHPTRRPLEGTVTQAGVPLQGGERMERVYWAAVVAKVPIREQLEIFKEAFQNARGYDQARDFPQYVGYQVQRREFVAGKPTDWKVVNVYDGQKKKAGNNVNIDTVAELNRLASAQWAGPAVEPIDPRWTDPVLTLPVPPLVGRNFGADATHPAIPLAINAPPPEVQEVATEGPAVKPEEADDGDFSAGTASQQGLAGREFASPMRSTGPGFGGGEFPGMRPGFGRGPGGPQGEFGSGGGMMSGGGMIGGGGISSGQHNPLPREVDHLLLRFFDYTVEPGKEYQYRVMVYIADPNNGIPLDPRILESAVIDRRHQEIQKAKAAKKATPTYRAPAEWSDPSPIVGIPFGGSVYVAAAKAPSTKTANDEPSITMFAETFDIEPADGSAIHVAKETELSRGAVINLKGKMQFTGDNGRWIDTKDSYALNTGLTVLDMDGGDEIGKKKTTPARVLLMDGAGQLAIREETDDSTNIQYLRYVFTDKPRKTNQGPGAEFGPEGPMRNRGGPR